MVVDFIREEPDKYYIYFPLMTESGAQSRTKQEDGTSLHVSLLPGKLHRRFPL